MPYPDQFTGFQIESADRWQDFKKQEYPAKPFGDYDIDVEIECCGICGSDLHTISGGWGSQHFPLTVGHGAFSFLFSLFFPPFPFSFLSVPVCRRLTGQKSSARPFASAPRSP